MSIYLVRKPTAENPQYPTLFNIVHKKQAKVVDVLSSITINVEFIRRALVGNKLLFRILEPLSCKDC
jgi:hypothetical protein